MKKALLFTFVLLLTLPNVTRAQMEFVDATNKRFLGRDPQVGSEVPEIKAWDEDGKEFQLGSTRGKHTVIIFGCLT